MAEQTSYHLDVSTTTKNRLTHDQTFHILEACQFSNDLTDLSQFPPMIYGFCLQWMVHQSVSLCHHYPDKPIMFFMWDYKSAYRRLHYDSDSTPTAISILEDYAYMWLWLTFGGKGNPLAWFAVSEMQTDLANKILSETTWNLEDLADSEFIYNLPPIKRLPDDIPFAQSDPTMVLPPPRPFGKADMFVDDGNAVTLDVNNNVQRAQVGVFKSTASQ
jgi:hypothetical protein